MAGQTHTPAPPAEAGLFSEVRRDPSLVDKVATALVKTIMARELRPGDRLPSQRELGEQFAVSRTVVREAVSSLVAKGLLEVRPGSGLRVAAVSGAAVRDSLAFFLRGSENLDYPKVHEIRSVLEVEMAGRAAERATSGDVAALRAACARMESAAPDVLKASQADVQFHRALARATHNELYEVLLDAIGEALIEVRHETLRHGALADALAAHRAILESVVEGDGARAREAMRTHLTSVEAHWRTSRQSGGERPGLP
jgi:GntR family transcriptional repressor for pyruvate dehydrogenase complex